MLLASRVAPSARFTYKRLTGLARCLTGLAVAVLFVAPAVAQDDDIVAIKAGTVITVSGETFTPGMVLIRAGKIEAVGKKIEVPGRAKVINAPDAVVMPGLVNPRSRFGLRARYRRMGNNADLSVAPELFPREGDFAGALEAGFVVLGLIPAGSGIPGNAVAIRPVDGARSQIVLAGSGYLRVTHTALPGDKRTLVGTFKAAQSMIDREAKAKKAFEAKALAAAKKAAALKKKGAPAPRPRVPPRPSPPRRPGPAPKPPAPKPAPKPGPTPRPRPKPGPKASAKPVKPPVFKPPPIPATLRPFVDFIRKPESAPRLVVEIARARDLVHFDDAVAKYKLSPVFFLGNTVTTDLHHALERVTKSGATVLIYPRVTLEPYTKTRRNLPAELAKGGVPLAFLPDTDDVKGFSLYFAGVAHLVREGMPREVALKAMTLVPARILGLDHELGTLEKGRRADLIFLDGDPFEAGSRVNRVMIDGKTVWTREESP